MRKVLFLVNGQGWGHAVRALMIAKKIHELDKSTMIYFASSEDGLRYFTLQDIDCLSLDAITYLDLYSLVKPDLIVSDEDFKALASYQLLLSKLVFITNYLDLIDRDTLTLLSQCHCVLFCEFSDSVHNKNAISDNVLFVGPPCSWDCTAVSTSNTEKTGVRTFIGRTILIRLGGCHNSSARLENYQLLYRLGKVRLHNYTFLLADTSYTALHIPWNTTMHVIDPGRIDQSLLDSCHLIIARGGWNTLWESAFLKKRCLSIPYSDKVNPLEEYTALTMKQRHLISSICLDNGQTDLQAQLAQSIDSKDPLISPASWIAQQPNRSSLNDVLRKLA